MYDTCISVLDPCAVLELYVQQKVKWPFQWSFPVQVYRTLPYPTMQRYTLYSCVMYQGHLASSGT